MFTPVDVPWGRGTVATRLALVSDVYYKKVITDVNEPNMLEVKIKKNNALFQSLNNYVVDRKPTSSINFLSFSQLM